MPSCRQKKFVLKHTLLVYCPLDSPSLASPEIPEHSFSQLVRTHDARGIVILGVAPGHNAKPVAGRGGLERVVKLANTIGRVGNRVSMILDAP